MKKNRDFLTILMPDDKQDDCLVDFKRYSLTLGILGALFIPNRPLNPFKS